MEPHRKAAMIPAMVWAFIVILSDGRGLPAGPYDTLAACTVVHDAAEKDADVVMLSDCIKVMRKLPSA